MTTAGQLDLVALNDLVRLQNSVPSAVDAVFKKISPQQHWKNYVEVHRHVLMVDNVFRVFVQNWNDLAQNAVDAICGFLEVPPIFTHCITRIASQCPYFFAMRTVDPPKHRRGTEEVHRAGD